MHKYKLSLLQISWLGFLLEKTQGVHNIHLICGVAIPHNQLSILRCRYQIPTGINKASQDKVDSGGNICSVLQNYTLITLPIHHPLKFTNRHIFTVKIIFLIFTFLHSSTKCINSVNTDVQIDTSMNQQGSPNTPFHLPLPYPPLCLSLNQHSLLPSLPPSPSLAK